MSGFLIRVLPLAAAFAITAGVLTVAVFETPVLSVHAEDVEAAYEEARRLGYEIVHPLTTEPWGVYRFFVRAPDGNVVTLVKPTSTGPGVRRYGTG